MQGWGGDLWLVQSTLDDGAPVLTVSSWRSIQWPGLSCIPQHPGQTASIGPKQLGCKIYFLVNLKGREAASLFLKLDDGMYAWSGVVGRDKWEGLQIRYCFNLSDLLWLVLFTNSTTDFIWKRRMMLLQFETALILYCKIDLFVLVM